MDTVGIQWDAGIPMYTHSIPLGTMDTVPIQGGTVGSSGLQWVVCSCAAPLSLVVQKWCVKTREPRAGTRIQEPLVIQVEP